MKVEDKIEILEEKELCDHCFGRQFARLGRGLENYERAFIIYDKREKGEEVDKDDFIRENIPEREVSCDESCTICGGLFNHLERYVKRVYNSLERYQFSTYLVGTRPPSEVVGAEEEIWEETGVQWVEPIKSELNRLIGKKLESRIEEEKDIDVDVDFKRADVNPVLDIEHDRVELQINSLLIHGFYNKLERGIPQTKWPCGNCRGKGCEECDWTGKQYQESVEEIVAEPIIRETKGLETKFHGAGREDVDAKCLGKREFVVEILEPENRDIELEKIQEEINNSEKVEVFNLEFCEKDMVERTKKRRSHKTYRAVVETDEEFEEADLEVLEELKGTIHQQTPSRVDHRRASKTRQRDVLDISWKKTGEKEFELTVKGEAGLYIKELISGDRERTEPSVSQKLGMETVCRELDVVGIEKPEGYEDV